VLFTSLLQQGHPVIPASKICRGKHPFQHLARQLSTLPQTLTVLKLGGEFLRGCQVFLVQLVGSLEDRPKLRFGGGPPRVCWRLRKLEENSELRRANEILKAASAYFARELDPRLPR
jgi:hypothetical protein